MQSAAEAAENKPLRIKAMNAAPVTTPAVVESEADKQKRLKAFEASLVEADALLNAGKSQEAYNLLEPLDFEYSGNVRFDYLLGIAALDSGLPDKATLAFERVLAVDPNFAGARLDMARAYFQLGDLPRAKTEFAAVLKQEPPEAARVAIEKYLAAIESTEQSKKTQLSGYVEGALGRDTNVNNSTSQAQVAVPALGNLVFTLSPTNLKTPDYYYTAAAGGEVNHDLTELVGEHAGKVGLAGVKWGVYGGADLRRRGNKSMTAFDNGSIDTRAGITLGIGEDVVRLGGSLSQFSLAHVTNRNAYGLSGDWRHSFTPTDQLNLFGQYGLNRFSDTAMKVNDFNLMVVGTGYLHLLDEGKAAIFSSVNYASEKAVQDRADGNKSGFGLRVGGQMSLLETADVFANVGYQAGRYSKENVAFLASRSDKQYDFSLGSNWHPDKFWSVRPQLGYSNNKSNIPIYSFDRVDASLTLHRDFR